MSTALERQDWLAERSRIPGVGASESAALFNLHPQISAFSLFEKLINPRPLTDEEQEEESDVQSFGHAIEPYLADWYSRKTGRAVGLSPFPLYRVKDRPYIFASPDRVYGAMGSNIVAIDGVLELKSALYFSPIEPLPDHWQIQVQQQCLCTGVARASFAILGGFRRRYHVDDIPRNDAFCSILVETIDRFMSAVQEGSWGRWGEDVEGSKATIEALRRLYKDESGETVELGEEELDRANQLKVVKEQLKLLETRESELGNQLKLRMGPATFGALPDGSRLSLRTVKGSTFTVNKQDTRQLRRIK